MPLAILQARMSSSRLPGKVLQPILGRPLILRALERILHAERLDGVVIATSDDSSDDLLAETVEAEGFTVRRGSLENVLGRFLSVIDEYQPADVVRLTGDNALTDPAVIDRVVEAHLASQADYTSNTMPRTFPRGLDVEVVRADVLREVARLAPDPDEREHVTMGIYRRADRFSLLGVTQSPDRSKLRWTVDYPDDLKFAREVYAELYEKAPDFDQEDILALLERRPDLQRFESDI